MGLCLETKKRNIDRYRKLQKQLIKRGYVSRANRAAYIAEQIGCHETSVYAWERRAAARGKQSHIAGQSPVGTSLEYIEIMLDEFTAEDKAAQKKKDEPVFSLSDPLPAEPEPEPEPDSSSETFDDLQKAVIQAMTPDQLKAVFGLK